MEIKVWQFKGLLKLWNAQIWSNGYIVGDVTGFTREQAIARAERKAEKLRERLYPS